ncbi:hypothetical protein Ngar_c27310 [Candidatus Nitrososphaera gargensis Ga9.2]|uniref:Uncharacterized protein n=1 Tax=Nitrososphaera gargensis (strain Ga9.2) TaxID=1237085 RepID=K0ILS8_NITGG|nr:PepSY domain-containing protein [Candidatus Nitrososphaera gargensis]AFU59652.1 hypothetical protein Ngar_c27310 [Candidatus Nitrososphaera gargensis Ga9.2]
MSSAKGSKLFASDRKSIIIMLTISLFALGVTAGVLLAYQQFTRSAIPNLIAEKDAIQLAIKEGNWDEQSLNDKKIEATLLHVKANGFSFIVDKTALHDTLTLYHSQFPNYEGQYIWIVSITAPNNRDWGYVIDATNGEILMQP